MIFCKSIYVFFLCSIIIDLGLVALFIINIYFAMSDFVIRDYHTQDFDEVNTLWVSVSMGGSFRGDSPEVIQRTLDMGGRLLILENKNTKEIIGTSWLTLDGRRVFLHHFGIKPEYQGNKLSHILLKRSLEFAKEKKMQIKLEVHKDNLKALQLYKKYGFEYLENYDVYIIRTYGKV